MPFTKTWYKNSINISFLSKPPFLIIFVELIDFLLLNSLFLQENFVSSVGNCRGLVKSNPYIIHLIKRVIFLFQPHPQNLGGQESFPASLQLLPSKSPCSKSNDEEAQLLWRDLFIYWLPSRCVFWSPVVCPSPEFCTTVSFHLTK